MKYIKAGECLSYGLGTELDEEYPIIGFENEHLKAFLTYFTLKGFLSDETAAFAKNKLNEYEHRIFRVTKEKYEEHFDTIAKPVIKDLKKHFEFSHFEELVELLDKEEIPMWAFQTNGALLNLFPQVCVTHEALYYIEKDEEANYFRYIRMDSDEQSLELADKEAQGKSVLRKFVYHTISDNYSEIVGFSEATQALILRFTHLSHMYAEYHVDVKEEVIYPYKCLGILDNQFPILEYDNDLVVKEENRIRKIKTINAGEYYEFKDGCIYVSPAAGKPLMFRPYILSLDGERKEIPDPIALLYMIILAFDFARTNEEIRLLEHVDRYNRLVDNIGDADETISFKMTEGFFLEAYKKRADSKTIQYKNLIEILKMHIQTGVELIDCFFILSDVSKRLTREGCSQFIADSVYLKFKEMHLSGELKAVIKDKEKLRNAFLQNVYWSDAKIAEKSREKDSFGCVGYFVSEENRLDYYAVTMDNAICVGKMMMGKWRESPGSVTYNIGTGIFTIQYYRELSKKEVQSILDAFRIPDTVYRVCVVKTCAS